MEVWGALPVENTVRRRFGCCLAGEDEVVPEPSPVSEPGSEWETEATARHTYQLEIMLGDMSVGQAFMTLLYQ